MTPNCALERTAGSRSLAAAVPTAPAWLQRAGLGADVMEMGGHGAGERGRWASNVDYAHVLGLLQADLARAAVATELRLRESLSLVRGDAIQLQQVILNLVLNAEAAMADGAGGPRQLTVETASLTPGMVEVSVRDTFDAREKLTTCAPIE